MNTKNTTKTKAVPYPYLPREGVIKYVSGDNPYLQAARQVAARQSLDKAMPTGSVVVKDGVIIGRGANGSAYHETHGCERVKRHIPTGQGYELCEGCHPKNHSEPRAVAQALAQQQSTMLTDASLYLWGHWWCCEPCWKAMLDAGIHKVFLLQGSDTLFNKAAPGNVVGDQFNKA